MIFLTNLTILTIFDHFCYFLTIMIFYSRSVFNESYKTHLIPSPSLFEWRLTSLSPSLSPFSSPILIVWKWRKNYIGKIFLQYESLSDKINFLSQRMPCYINYIWIAFLIYDFLDIWLIIFSRKLLDVSFTFKNIWHKNYIGMDFL